MSGKNTISTKKPAMGQSSAILQRLTRHTGICMPFLSLSNPAMDQSTVPMTGFTAATSTYEKDVDMQEEMIDADDLSHETLKKVIRCQ